MYYTGSKEELRTPIFPPLLVFGALLVLRTLFQGGFVKSIVLGVNSLLVFKVLFKGNPKVYTSNMNVLFYGVFKIELSTAWILMFVFTAAL
ncbi:hypothetical protein P3T76_003294 [Phytophthora citrophthora]|uniref:Uncharacterized protein n=1 Tax=Phytophthora citrophthora TaxID=4793 RepID=A0AAD9GVD1_9STRA|nr:hypothetical protein P3T76_003294 [Phytophthora citrophthora]